MNCSIDSIEKRLPLSEVLPKLASELRQLLEGKGESTLAAQVPGLMILDRCRCGDDICATFYTQLRPKDGFGPGHRTAVLAPEEGMLLVDVVAEGTACVEVLDRKDVPQKLQAVLP